MYVPWYVHATVLGDAYQGYKDARMDFSDRYADLQRRVELKRANPAAYRTSGEQSTLLNSRPLTDAPRAGTPREKKGHAMRMGRNTIDCVRVKRNVTNTTGTST